jgi:hypothetical protein
MNSDVDPTLAGAKPVTPRSRRRRSVIVSSAQREEYVRLMESGWSSMALERYAYHRYGEDIPASTFRAYKAKRGIKVEVSVMRGRDIDPDRTHDVVATRQELIALQMARIGIDAQHERDMKKLFGTTRGEISLLSMLLDAAKGDLQDLGLFPKAGETITVKGDGPDPESIPKARTLAEAMGDGTALAESSDLAKVLHLLLPTKPA